MQTCSTSDIPGRCSLGSRQAHANLPNAALAPALVMVLGAVVQTDRHAILTADLEMSCKSWWELFMLLSGVPLL